MAEPVIIDDGASTRIRGLWRAGLHSAGIIWRIDPGNPPRSNAVQCGPFHRVAIASVDIHGAPHAVFEAGLHPRDHFTVASGNCQFVNVRVDLGGHCTLSLQGEEHNPPELEARMSGGSRRYVVANAGAIQRINGVIGGEPMDYHAQDAIYTSILLE
jgi:hypothetical protein